MKRLIFIIASLLCFHTPIQCAKKIIYITPGLWLRLFDIVDPFLNGDDQRQSTHQLKLKLQELGFEVRQADTLKNLEDPYAIIAFDVPFDQLNDLKQYPKEQCILFLWEPPSVTPGNYDPQYHDYFSKIYTWIDGLVDNKKYFKFYYPVMRPIIADTMPYEQKKLCTIIACNKHSNHTDELYSARREAIAFFENNHLSDFDLYGYGWGNQLKCYKGSITRKVDRLKHYKFSICYENIKDVPGYVTEKIFDCFRAGCVPIYWGASNIGYYVPEECFLDRRNFNSNEELYEYITHMPKEIHEAYLHNIRQFLTSPQAALYSVSNFVNIVLYALFGKTRKPQPEPLNVCTAANDKYFDCLLNLIGSLHKNNFDELGHIAVFDIGLTPSQQTTLSTIQKVQVYPIEHTNQDILTPFNTRPWGKPVPGWYTWKPVAIKQAFDIFPPESVFLWIDAGTTILRDLSDLVLYIKEHGYFFHNGCNWSLKRQLTQLQINTFQLESPENNWLLQADIQGLESGFMGFSEEIYHSFIIPAYETSKDIRLFADDGTTPGGFGDARHDQNIFSLVALLNHLAIFHHFKSPKDNLLLDVKGTKVPFHIACNPEDRTADTHVYCSRYDTNLKSHYQAIHFKKPVLIERH